MIIGVGTDIVEISRFEALIEDAHFTERVFKPDERAYVKKHGAQSAAGIWAAKEAVYKATGCRLSDIEIHHLQDGRPTAVLHGFHESPDIHLSISHDGGYAVAFAVAEKK